MASSIWGYFVVMLGVLSLLVVNYVGNFANNNELDYYAVREIQQSAMMDALDVEAYRTDGVFKISKETFVEQFTKRFAEAAGVNRKYQIIFETVMEEPPMTTVTIKSAPSTNINEVQSSTLTEEDLFIQNRVSGILLLDDPVVNLQNIPAVAPTVSIKTMYRSCPFVNGVMQVNERGAVDIFVNAQNNDLPVQDLTLTETITINGVTTSRKFPVDSLAYEKHIDARDDAEIKYQINALAKYGTTLSKSNSRTIVLKAGEKCQQVIERPTVSITPLNECGSGSIDFDIIASGNSMTDLYFTVNGSLPITILNKRSVTVNLTSVPETPGKIKVSAGTLFTPFVVDNMPKGNSVKVWATPAGAPEYMSPEKYGVYTINSVDQIQVNPLVYEYKPGLTNDLDSSEIQDIPMADLDPLAPDTWTRKDVIVKLNPTFSIGSNTEENTVWGWWTNRRPLNEAWQGYQHFSNNLSKGNQVVKVISAEGRRKFKVTVDLPSSKVGLGCNNARLSSNTTNQYLIDKTPPPKPNIKIVDLGGDEIMKDSGGTTPGPNGDNNWYVSRLRMKVVNALDYGETNETGSGTVTFDVDWWDGVTKNADGDPDYKHYEEYDVSDPSLKDGSEFTIAPRAEPETGYWANSVRRFRVRAIDQAGNKSTTKKEGYNTGAWEYITFKVDTTHPTCESFTDHGYASPNWSKTNVTFTATCDDNLSQCTKTTFTKTFGHGTDGSKNINVEDNAGLRTPCLSGGQTVRVDTVAPTIKIWCSHSACNYGNNTQPATGYYSYTESGSGIAKSSFAMRGGTEMNHDLGYSSGLVDSSLPIRISEMEYIGFKGGVIDHAGWKAETQMLCDQWENYTKIAATPSTCGATYSGSPVSTVGPGDSDCAMVNPGTPAVYDCRWK